MKITPIRIDNDISHVALIGRLDSEGMQAVDTVFHGYTASRHKPTLVDLSQLEYIASLGIGMLISCAKSLERDKAKMVLYAPQEMVEDVLTTIHLPQVIPIVKTQEEALRLLMTP